MTPIPATVPITKGKAVEPIQACPWVVCVTCNQSRPEYDLDDESNCSDCHDNLNEKGTRR
jgi:hypothetical protein